MPENCPNLPASNHSVVECSRAFEWLRNEATKEGASPHAGVVLDEWHALAKPGLIAAAPDLLAACYSAIELIREWSDFAPEIQILAAAIAKAEGRS